MKDNDPLVFKHWRKNMAPAIKKAFPLREEVTAQIAETQTAQGGIGKLRLAEIMASVPRGKA